MFKISPNQSELQCFMDSGAYSAWSQNDTILAEDYGRFLLATRQYIHVYANLDDKRSWRQTMANQRTLESMGLNPIPVYHAGEPWELLDDLIAEYPYIALGGIANDSGSSQAGMRWMIECFRRAEGKTVFHGFGMTVWDRLKAFPWYSVDSTSWASGFRFGGLIVFDYKRGEFVHVNIGDRKSCLKHRRVIMDYGYNPIDIADRSRYQRSIVAGLCAASFAKAELWLERRHGMVTIPER